MRLAIKLTAALVSGIVCVMVVYAWVQVSNEVRLSDVDAYHARRRGLGWLGAIESVWGREGEERARELIAMSMRRAAAAGEEGETLRIVSLADNAPDRPALSAEERRALDAGEITRPAPDDARDDWEHVYARIRTAAEPTAIEVVRPHHYVRTFVRMSHLAILCATAAAIAICALLAAAVQIRFVGRPLEWLRDKARRAGAGDFSRPLALRQRDEIGELADEINAMCARIAEAKERAAKEGAARVSALEHLRHTDRLATVGQLAAGVAHELGTPLNVIGARAERLVAGDDAAANARVILDQTQHMTAIVKQLLDFSRRRGTTMGLANLDQVVDRTVDLLVPAAQKANVRVERSGSGPFLARMDQSQMQQVLANLLMNGIQAMPRGGRLRVSVEARRARPPADPNAPEGDWVCVNVEDEGTGIPSEELAHVFEPFFTTKGAGDGTGLGLAVAQGIVADHGGWIDVESDVGKGSRFSIFLPRPAEPAKAAS